MNPENKYSLLDIKINKCSKSELHYAIKDLINSKTKSVISFINPEILYSSYKNKILKSYFNEVSTYNLIDGVGIILVNLLKGKYLGPRNTGTDFMLEIAELCVSNRKSIFYLGSEEEINLKAIEFFQNKFPDLKIAGVHNGYFKNEKNIIKKINNSRSDVLVVCLGHPKQEYFILNNIELLNVKLIFGNGGALDYYGGKVIRAPFVLRYLGMEWFWRLFQDPTKRRLKRQFKLIPFFFKSIFYQTPK